MANIVPYPETLCVWGPSSRSRAEREMVSGSKAGFQARHGMHLLCVRRDQCLASCARRAHRDTDRSLPVPRSIRGRLLAAGQNRTAGDRCHRSSREYQLLSWATGGLIGGYGSLDHGGWPWKPHQADARNSRDALHRHGFQPNSHLSLGHKTPPPGVEHEVALISAVFSLVGQETVPLSN